MQVFVCYNSERAEFELPDIMDVLIHLPESPELREKGLCVAHAIQYNISAKGSNPEEALARLVDLVVVHCRLAMEEGIDPVNMAAESYVNAWHLGVLVPPGAASQKINARFSQELAKSLNATLPRTMNVDVRDICDKQKARNMATVEELVDARAA